jgi:hypothetical protein
MKYIDLSIEPAIAYIISRMLKSDYYRDVLIYEFHEEVDVDTHFNCLQGLDQFRERASDFYGAFLQPSIVDNYPAIIHLLIKLSNEWFVVNDCGANYYLGYGPTGIIELRRNCKFKGVKIIYQEGILNNFIKSQSDDDIAIEQKDEYEKIIGSIILFCTGLERGKQSLRDLKEENIRDNMLPALNTIFEGRVFGEAKNVKGKTDILLRETGGINQYIFELKVWSSIVKFEEGYEQLLGYLSRNDDKAGMIIFSYRKSLSGVIKKVESFFKNKKAKFIQLDESRKNELRIETNHKSDKLVKLTVHLFFVDLHKYQNNKKQ